MQDHAQGYRLSPQQHLLWTQGQDPGFLQASFTLAGSVDRQRLLDAFNTLLEHHEVLRTHVRVVPGSGVPAQYVHPYNPLSALPEQLGRASEPAELALVCEPAASRISLRLHAMCGDAWTLGALLEQLDRRYASQQVSEGQADRLQYPDLAEAFNQLLGDQEGHAYWHRRSNEQAAPALETWRDNWLDGPTLRHARVLEWVPRSPDGDPLFERWALFLSQLTHSPLVQLCYRTPGRQMLELDALGPMARSLPVSFLADGARSIAALTNRLGAQLRDDLAQAVHCPGVPADLPPSWFQFDAACEAPGRFAGFPTQDVQLLEPTSKALLHLSVIRCGDELRLHLRAQDCSEARFAECAQNLERWLCFCERSPDAPPVAFEWQPLDMHLLPVDTGPAGHQVGAPGIDVLGALRQAALHTPEKMALRDVAGTLSCAELQVQVLGASQFFAARGIRAGDVVALQLERGRHWLSLWLACWQLGAVALPISLKEPVVRLARLCSLTQARLLVTDVLEPSDDLPPCVRTAQCQVSGAAPPAVPLLAGAIAYILFTSGSTGEPKATAVSHGALMTYLQWARRAYASGAKGGTIVHSELTFDFTQPCLWLPLLEGEPVYFAAEGIKLDGLYRMLLDAPELSFIKLAPAHLQGMSAMESDAAQTPAWPAHVVVGGAALSGAMLPSSLRRSAALIHNEYGPTEAAVGCSLYSVRADQMAMEATPIGAPCPGNRFMVLDDYLNRMPPGATGELYICGEQLAQGYLGNPRETALRFVPHPYATLPGQRMYRSGDRVERLSLDDHVFRGRMDDMVKRNGFRIEPGEITVRMLQHPRVTGCHTLVQHNEGQAEPRIVCAVVCPQMDADVLRTWLASALPEYMLPNEIVAIDTMPLTRQGKVDTEQLELLLAGMGQHTEALLPGAESALGAIWQGVLGARRLGPRSNFFVEGGDSIRAISVAVLARKGGWPLTVEDLFGHPVLRDLAVCCEMAAKQAAKPLPSATLAPAPSSKPTQPALPAGVEDAFPLSQLQLGMIYQNQAHDQDSRYHDIFSYGLALQFDESCLSEAARRLVQRHPCLRTSFDLTGFDEPMQLVWTQGAELLDVQDISTWPPAEQQACVQCWIAQERERGFDTRRLPLVRIKVHVLGAREIQLTTSFHHAIMDGWSDQQIHTELFADYSDLLHDRKIARSAPSSRYRDFVAAERAALRSPQTRGFWADLLAGKVPNELSPGLAGSEPPTDGSAGYQHLALDISVPDQHLLRQHARAAGQALSVLLLSVHMLVLARLSGRREVLSGAVSNCRLDEDAAERAVGLYINTLPVVASMEAGPWSSLIEQMGHFQQAAFAHRRLPFAEIQRDMGVAMLSQSLFYFTSFHNGIGQTQELRQLRKLAHEVTSFPLTASFNLDPLTEQISCRLSFDSRRFAPQRIEIVHRLYNEALASLASGLEGPLPSAEQLLPMALCSVVAAPLAGQAPDVLVMLADQALQHGNALAVAAADRELSYRQLDMWSDLIAGDLRAHGAGVESVVAVSLPRSAMLVAALLGVLKAGACFTVLDPDNPPQRLRHMLEGANLLLCGQSPASGHDLPEKLQVLTVRDMDAGAAPLAAVSVPTSAMQAAYRMYTSGTTGTPKCVVLSRGNLANVLWHFRAALSVRQGDRVLLNSALSFDISLLELFLPLVSGASLVVLDRKEVMDPAALAQVIDKTGASLMQATPSQWALLRAAGWKGSQKLRVLTGGETLPAHLGDWLVDACAQVWNVYGPTETCIWSSARRLSAEAPLTLGVPIAHTRCYVLDEMLDPVPLGSEGMLYIGGAGLSRGYHGDPAASAAAFLPDRFAGQPGARMYCTGDRVRMNADAELVFLGRADRQIKLAGHRLELAEIEARLLQHRGVAAAIVVEAADDALGLVAYLMPGSEAHAPAALPSAAELRTFLAQSLAPPAVPSRYVWISDIPRTRNGKLDLSALPAPDKLEVGPSVTGSPTRAIELLLLKLWSRVLHVDEVGVGDSFVSLGGYSLSAIQIVAQLRKLLDIDVSAALVFSAPTIVQFADHLLERFPTADIEAKAEVVLSIL